MSTLSVVNTIESGIAQYAPAAIAAVQAAEVAGAASSASGASKQVAVVSAVLGGIQVGSGALENSPNPTIAGVAGLVNLIVSIFNSLNLFKHSTPAKAAA